MSSTTNAIRMKWLGAAAVGTVAAGLIIFLFAGQDKTAEQTTPLTTAVSSETTTPSKETTVAVATEDQTSEAKVQQPVVVKKEKTTAIALEKSNIKAFDNSASFNETENTGISTPNSDATDIPTNTLFSETNNKLSNLSVTVDNSNLKDKSYQFTGPKLTLFGDFNSKPYELLELNNKGQKTLFLSYNNEYYELVWGQMKKTPLKKVTHKETIEKLKVINP